MINPDILRFIGLRQREGMSRENIRNLLMREGGWNKDDVEEAFGIIDHDANRPPSAPPVKPASSEAPMVPQKLEQDTHTNETGQSNAPAQSGEHSYAAIIAGVVLLALIAAGVVLMLFTDVLNL